MARSLLLLALLLAFTSAPSRAQSVDLPADRAGAAVDYLQVKSASMGLLPSDALDLFVADGHVSPNGIAYAYVRQRLGGIEVAGAQVTVALDRNGRVFHTAGDLRAGIERAAESRVAAFGAAEALLAASRLVSAGLSNPVVAESKSDASRSTRFEETDEVSGQPLARLVYFPMESGRLRLAWEVTLWPRRGSSLWLMHIDAATGAELARQDLTVYDNWGPATGAATSLAPLATDVRSATSAFVPLAESALRVAGYRVFAAPDESPQHGVMARTLISGAEHLNASPFGWHDTDGVAGAEFTIARGNNAHAYADRNDSDAPDAGEDTDGTAALAFDFPIDFANAPNTYTDAAVSNLFYWNNVFHDIMHRYGFDEAGGNFQANNYGNGGAGGDPVQAEAQDGGDICNDPNNPTCTNNANFGTPSDGGSPRMQMYEWTTATPRLDGDLDAGIIVHEFGHGVSNRLVAGPSMVSCLGNSEQMGEGWSDFLGLIVTQQVGDTRTTGRGIGTYALAQPTTGAGIRPARYSTDFGVNNFTYQSSRTQLAPHGVGFVWATILWEVTWDMIDAHGYSADVYNAAGTAGNQMMLSLVTTGLKMTPCNPGFVDGRDAIIAADAALYPDVANPGRGVHYATLWGAFARRGLGASASQGLSSSNGDNTEAFDLPIAPGSASITPGSISTSVAAGGMTTRSVSVSNTAVGGSPSLTFTAGIVGGNLLTGPPESPTSGTVHVEHFQEEQGAKLRDAARDSPLATAPGSESRTAASAPALAGGGPDAFGYSWKDSNEPGGPTYAFTNISGTGTAVALTDDSNASVPIGFSFPFYGTNYTDVFIGSNGILSFGVGASEFNNASIPTAAAPNAFIAPFWDDLNPSSGGTIHYETVSGKLLIQFTNILRFGGSTGFVSFQVSLAPSGEIQVNYQAVPTTNNSATIGIENQSGTVGLQVAFNAAYAAANLAVRFSPPSTWVSVAPATGSVAPGGSATLTVTFDATDLTEGTYTADLVLGTNDPAATTVTIPLTLTVTGSTTVAGAEGWRLLASPSAALTVADLAAMNLVQGITGSYPPPEALPNLFTGYNGVGDTYTPSTGITEVLAPGKGFWWYLYNQNITPGGASNSTVLPMTLVTSHPITTADVPVALHANNNKWNMLGNPFGTSIDVGGANGVGTWTGNTLLLNNVVHAYDASISNYRTSTTDPVFASWQGFFAEGNTAGALTIPAAARATGGTLMRSAGDPASLLAFELSAVNGPQKDVAAVLHVSPDATDGRDRLDASKLEPADATFVTVGFGSEDGGLRAVESRPPDAASFSLPVFVASIGAGESLELTWPRMENLPADWRFSLRDLVTGETIDLRAESSYAFSVAPTPARISADTVPNAHSMTVESLGAISPRFELIVETGSVVANESGTDAVFSLDAPRPNPVTSTTRLGFSLAEAGGVRLSVIDIQGREVAVILDEDRPAGSGAAVLDVSAFASGVYVLRLDTGSQLLTRRLVVAR